VTRERARLSPDAAIALGLYVLTASVYALSHSGRLDMIDAQFKFDTTWSLLTHGDTLMRDPALQLVLHHPQPSYAPYGLAPSLAGLPLAWLGYVLSPATPELAQFGWALTQALLGALTIPLLFRIWRGLNVERRPALLASLTVAFGSLLWTSAASSFDQAPQAALVLACVWKGRQALTRTSLFDAALSGASFGLLVHYQAAFVLLGLPLTLALLVAGRACGWRKSVRLASSFVMGAAPLVLGLLAYNAHRFGSPFRLSAASAGIPLFDNPLLGAAVLLLSPGKSIFLFSPVVVLALLGARGLLKTDRALFLLAAVATSSHLLLVSSLSFPSGDWCWGPRYLVLTLPLVCLALPWSTAAGRWGSRAVTGWSVAVQVLALTLDHQRYFFERSLSAQFWLHNHGIYFRDSQLLGRVGEICANAPHTFSRFTSAPSPLSTYAPFGPPPSVDASEWVTHFAVFFWPRPWPLWMARLPEPMQILDPFPLALGFAALALAGAALVVRGVRSELQPPLISERTARS
jgi:hypothetical protein